MTRRRSRKWLETRAPRKGTVVAASILYVLGLFGYLDFYPIGQNLSVAALALAGALLLLGAFLRAL